jgi:hypothetical protein
MMGGVNPSILPPRHYQQDAKAVASDVARDLVDGDVVVLHASEIDRITLSATSAEIMTGVVGQVEGAEASPTAGDGAPVGPDSIAWYLMWADNVRKVRIQDNATVAYGDDLMISSVTPGALVLAAGAGVKIVGRCKKTIAVGAVDQFTICDIGPPSRGVV